MSDSCNLIRVRPFLLGWLLVSPMDCFAQVIANGTFAEALSNWTLTEGGGGNNAGSVLAEDGRAVFREAGSFSVSLRQTFNVPPQATVLTFDVFADPGFDRGSAFIPDAFEAGLLTPGSQATLSEGWKPQATTFFNMQENGTVHLGPRASFDGTTVTLDISEIPENTEATILFCLIGGDRDADSTVAIDNVAVPVPTREYEFEIAFSPYYFDRRTGQFVTYARVTNVDQVAVGTPNALWLLIDVVPSPNNPNVFVANAHGVVDGSPAFDISGMLGPDGVLDVQETSGPVQIRFNNPTRGPFGIDRRVVVVQP